MREKIETMIATWVVCASALFVAAQFVNVPDLVTRLLERIRWWMPVLLVAVLLPTGCGNGLEPQPHESTIESMDELEERVTDVVRTVGRIVSLRDCYMSAGPNLGLDELAVSQCRILVSHVREIEESPDYLLLLPEQLMQVEVAKWLAGDCSDIFVRFRDRKEFP